MSNDSGKPTAMLRNGKLYYYITNQMGDVIGVADADGNLAVENFYDAWGDNYTSAIETCDFDGQTGWNGAYKLYNANPMRYRGYYYDVGIGMYYLKSRYYNPMVNRFFNADDPDIARESKDIAVGMNLFAYCNNDPVNHTDYAGQSAKYRVTVRYYLHPLGKSNNIFGHMDISFGGNVYSYGDYYYYKYYKTKSSKKAKKEKVKYNLTIAPFQVHMNYMLGAGNFYVEDYTSLYLNKTEYNRLKSYYNSLDKKYHNKTKDGRERWKITAGPYKSYHTTYRNCSTLVRDALEYATSSKARSVMVKCVDIFGLVNTPYRVNYFVNLLRYHCPK